MREKDGGEKARRRIGLSFLFFFLPKCELEREEVIAVRGIRSHHPLLLKNVYNKDQKSGLFFFSFFSFFFFFFFFFFFLFFFVPKLRNISSHSTRHHAVDNDDHRITTTLGSAPPGRLGLLPSCGVPGHASKRPGAFPSRPSVCRAHHRRPWWEETWPHSDC